MNVKSQNLWNLIIVVLLVLVAGIGCGLIGVSALNLTPASAVASPPTAVPVVTPIPDEVSDEAEALDALQSQIITVYGAVSPAVVNITNRSYAYDMFMRAVPQEGSGSGFVYDTEGHIVTNYHVVENAEELLVTLASGQVYEAEIVGVDQSNDLAVIRIDAGAALPEPVVLGDSDRLQVGQFVLAIGNPFGLEQTLTTGVISALGRVIENSDGGFIGEAIQTDAAINPGNSGGPLLDLQGRVVGVNSQIISPSGGSAGIGFAVSANTVQRVTPELIARGYYPHPWLGTQMLTLTPATAGVLREAGMNVPVDAGLLVIEVVEGAAADKAGIRGGTRLARIGRYQIPLDGDIIVAVNGEPVADSQELTVYLEMQTTVGDRIELTIIRDGEERIVAATLEERPRT
jgi:S1-C subfamily serine protease